MWAMNTKITTAEKLPISEQYTILSFEQEQGHDSYQAKTRDSSICRQTWKNGKLYPQTNTIFDLFGI
jgi:hypothetical protein